jgi:hypothetical protein
MFYHPLEVSDVWSVVARSRAVNVASPVLDLIDSTVTVFESLVLEDPQLPGEKPSEHGSHEEADGNHTDDEDEGEVKDDVRSNATDALGIDEANSGDILQTLTKCPLVGPEEVHGEIPAVEGTVGALQLVENRRIFDLSRGRPVEEVHVDDGAGGAVRTSRQGGTKWTYDSKTARLRLVSRTSSQV